MSRGQFSWASLLVTLALAACTKAPVAMDTNDSAAPAGASSTTSASTVSEAVTTTLPEGQTPTPDGYRTVELPEVGASLAIPNQWVTRDMSEGDLAEFIGQLGPVNLDVLSLLEAVRGKVDDTYLFMAFQPTAAGYATNVNVTLTPASSEPGISSPRPWCSSRKLEDRSVPVRGTRTPKPSHSATRSPWSIPMVSAPTCTVCLMW